MLTARTLQFIVDGLATDGIVKTNVTDTGMLIFLANNYSETWFVTDDGEQIVVEQPNVPNTCTGIPYNRPLVTLSDDTLLYFVRAIITRQEDVDWHRTS